MSILERLYSLEIEFHRLFRLQAPSASEGWDIHTSYALQNGYEMLLRSVGAVDAAALADTRERMIAERDPRDVDAAYRTLRQLLA